MGVCGVTVLAYRCVDVLRCLAIRVWLSVARSGSVTGKILAVCRCRAKWMRAWRILTGVSRTLPHPGLVVFHLPSTIRRCPSPLSGKKQGTAPKDYA